MALVQTISAKFPCRNLPISLVDGHSQELEALVQRMEPATARTAHFPQLVQCTRFCSLIRIAHRCACLRTTDRLWFANTINGVDCALQLFATDDSGTSSTTHSRGHRRPNRHFVARNCGRALRRCQLGRPIALICSHHTYTGTARCWSRCAHLLFSPGALFRSCRLPGAHSHASHGRSATSCFNA